MQNGNNLRGESLQTKNTLRAKRKFLVLTFASTEDALALEAKCAAENLPGRIIPTPTSISAGCGLAWRVESAEAEIFLGRIEKFSDVKFARAGEIEMW